MIKDSRKLILYFCALFVAVGWIPKESLRDCLRPLLFPPASSTSASPKRTSFRLALDIAQVPARQVVYIENTPMFVEVAQSLGIHGSHHQGLETTRSALKKLGLK